MGIASLKTLPMSFATLATQSVYQNNWDFIMFTSFGHSEAFCSYTSRTHFTLSMIQCQFYFFLRYPVVLPS